MILLLNISTIMGVKNSRESEVSLMKEYNIIERSPNENLTFLQHKKTEKEYLLKQFNFNDKRQCEKMMQKLASLKSKLSGNKYVVSLTHFFMTSQDQYCSTFYKIYAVYEYPQRTLLSEITERKLHKKHFTETELWSILASCIVGLSHLQRNGIKHSALKSSTILLSQEGVVKIADPFAVGLTTNQDAALTKKSILHAYLSPEQTKALQQESPVPGYNTFKSDIFTLGMIMLQAGLLEFQDEECYRDEKTRIHWQAVQYNIDRLGQAYSEEIKNMVEFMLSRDERARPDWIDLEEHVMKGAEEGRKSITNEHSRREESVLMRADSSAQVAKQAMVLTAPNRTSGAATFVSNTPLLPPFHPQNSAAINGLVSPRGRAVSQPAQFSVGSAYNGLEYNRVLQVNPSHTMTLAPTQNHYSFGSDSVAGPTSPPSSSLASPHGLPIPPLRPSIIEYTRPTRNIFPCDTYTPKTRFDQNMILIMEDDDEEQNNPDKEVGNLPTLPIVGFQQQPSSGTSNPATTKRFEEQLSQAGPSLQTSPAQHSTIYSQLYTTRAQQSPGLQFVKEQFKMGSKYEGYKLRGLRHGYGKFYYQDGGMYDGTWQNNKMEGQGKLYYQSGKLAYDGEWKGDQFMGRGTLYNELPESLNGGFNYSNFDDVDEHWTKYEGDFSDDKKNGKGTLFLANGEKFEGTFVDDCVEGSGVFYCRNGAKVSGVWRANKMVK